MLGAVGVLGVPGNLRLSKELGILGVKLGTPTTAVGIGVEGAGGRTAAIGAGGVLKLDLTGLGISGTAILTELGSRTPDPIKAHSSPSNNSCNHWVCNS